MSDHLAVMLQYLLPKQAITVFAGKVANIKGGVWTARLIHWFIGRYKVNMSEAANPDVRSYSTFNDFFTRALRSDARPLAQADYLVRPVHQPEANMNGVKNQF